MNKKKIIPFLLAKPYLLYLFAILLGVVVGLSPFTYLQSFALLVADIFIKIFKCISMPIIALSIIVTLSSYNNIDGSMNKIFKKTITYTLMTTIIAATLSCVLYLLIKPQNIAMVVPSPLPTSAVHLTYWQHLSALMPANIFSPFLENQVMSVLLLGTIIGMAARFVPDQEAKTTIINFFKGVHGIFFVITRWVVALLPLALFGFMTSSVMQFHSGIHFSGLGAYLLVIISANLIQGWVVLPLWLKSNGARPFDMFKKMAPALSVAFFSKSSAGTLPITINTVEARLNVNPKISRFVLPLCTTVNMNGCAAFIFTTVIFLMQNNGVPINASVMIVWIIIATIAAIGNAGVPMGCFFLSMSLLTSMDIPIGLMGLILPFYTLIDMVETALNVWSDSCVAKIVQINNAPLSEVMPKDLAPSVD